MATAIGGTTGALFALSLMAAFGGGLLGCSGRAIDSPDSGKMTCTEIGCHDQFTATVTVDATMVPAGMHSITVTVDGAATSCPFAFPPDTGLGEPCSAGFGLAVLPAQSCTTTQTETVTSQQCQPIEGKFVETITVDGTPSSIQVQQTVGGTVIFDQTASPAYQTNEPNGPGCGPICHQAGAEWTIPQ
jgi:hypothetical protein